MVLSFCGTIICFATKAVPLRSIKGFPCTMDVEAFLADLKLLKQAPDNDEEDDGGTGGDGGCNGTIKLPDYDRTLHDPVPGRIEVGAHHKLVVVEGLHLLHDQGRWSVCAFYEWAVPYALCVCRLEYAGTLFKTCSRECAYVCVCVYVCVGGGCMRGCVA